MVTASLAGTIETLFAGWELVGLSSALLVAFYHERTGPVRNGLRVWIVYRISDAALLLAAVVLHHMAGEGDFDKLLGVGPWPDGSVELSSAQMLLVGGLLIFAAAGKSALIPFSGWLPRAMEGPTPSSAVFYGALSVHLGAYLLLRISPMITASPTLTWVVIALGLATAALAALIARVQTDIKSALSFASLTQVGLIVAEIGCGWSYFALTHLMGHAFFRTLQFIRAPSILRDRQALEDALGGQPPSLSAWPLWAPVSGWFYRFASERGYLDGILDRLIIGPFVGLCRWCDALERRATNVLSGEAKDEKSYVSVISEPEIALPFGEAEQTV
jgi:NAD(P)H-quinone oxidoreductase subunit 5